MRTEIHTVVDLKRAIEGRPDDELVHAQVVAADGTAWNMRLTIGSVFQQPLGVVVDMRHPDLKTLPSAA